MIYLKVALKTVLSYKRRSLTTIILIVASTSLLIFASAFMEGSHNKMIESSVEIYKGYLQITHRDFRENPGLDHLIFDVAEVSEKLKDNEKIAELAPRFETFVLFVSDEKSTGGMLTGIKPEKEKRLSRLAASLQKGRYLKPEDGNALYIGSELAKRLRVVPGDKVDFIGSGADYSFAADSLTVKGVFQTGLFDFDASASFLNRPYFNKIMSAEDLATHLIVLPEDPAHSAALASELQKVLGNEYEAASWQKTMSGLVEAMKVDSIFGYLTLAVIFIVIFFVIMIYTLLNVFARTREIGVLRAIGTGPGQILTMLLAEGIILTAVGVALGGLIGGGSAWYFQENPINFAAYEEQFKQYGLAASSLPTVFEPLSILRDALIIFVLCLLVNLYPIYRVNSLSPVEALRHV